MTLTIFSAKTSPRLPPKTGEVLAEDEDHPAVDRAVAGDHAVAPGPVVLQAEAVGPVAGEHVELGEAARVEQEVDPLAGGQLAARRAGARWRPRCRRARPPRAAPAGARASCVLAAVPGASSGRGQRLGPLASRTGTGSYSGELGPPSARRRPRRRSARSTRNPRASAHPTSAGRRARASGSRLSVPRAAARTRLSRASTAACVARRPQRAQALDLVGLDARVDAVDRDRRLVVLAEDVHPDHRRAPDSTSSWCRKAASAIASRMYSMHSVAPPRRSISSIRSRARPELGRQALDTSSRRPAGRPCR